MRLAGLLAERGDLEEAAQVPRPRGDAGDVIALIELAMLLARHGDLDALRAQADAGNAAAVWHLNELLEKRVRS
jgi:hypothetical protein